MLQTRVIVGMVLCRFPVERSVMTETGSSRTAVSSVNMPTVAMDTDMRVLRSVMGKTLDTKHVIHIFQGKICLQLYATGFKTKIYFTVTNLYIFYYSSYGHLKCTPHCVIDSTNCKFFT
ncbi:hypothetical protein NQD34_012152 [Periophthalmus magnuspinnatus]|nr:hypothetical protein NQD34_012152 [Periophthalmus magnuspinnatus]